VSKIDWPAVRFGVLHSIVFALPLAVVSQVLVGEDRDDIPLFALVLFIAVLLSLVYAGFLAARQTTEMPYATGGVAALATFVLVQAIGVVVNVLQGDSLRVTSIVFNGLIAYGCGIFGAAVIIRQRARA
jgi:putative membrane protein (TIGR04086 family)